MALGQAPAGLPAGEAGTRRRVGVSGTMLVPAPTQRLIQRDEILQPRELHADQRLLSRIQRPRARAPGPRAL
jgi:hypothetical protein